MSAPRRLPARMFPLTDRHDASARAARRVMQVLETELGNDWQKSVQVLFATIHGIAHHNGVRVDDMISLHRQCSDQLPKTWYSLTAMTDGDL